MKVSQARKVVREALATEPKFVAGEPLIFATFPTDRNERDNDLESKN